MKERTALHELLTLVEKGEPIMPDMKMRLIKLMKNQLTEAYELDPELMRVRYRNAQQWFYDKYKL